MQLQKTDQNEAISLLSRTHFEVSNGSEIVKAYLGTKIRDIDPLNDEPIKAVLRYVFTLIGLKPENIPDEIAKTVLIDFIRKDLKNYGLEEIPIAFRKAIKGDLEIDPNHYQSFSPLYLSNILNAYSKDRNKAIRNYLNKVDEIKRENEEKMTPTELYQKHESWIRNGILKPYKYYLETGFLTFGITPYSIIFKTLDKDINILKISPEDKSLIYEEAKKIILEDIENRKEVKSLNDLRDNRRIRELIEKNGADETLKNDIVRKCHEISVRRFFEEAKKTDRDIETEINNYLDNLKNDLKLKN